MSPLRGAWLRGGPHTGEERFHAVAAQSQPVNGPIEGCCQECDAATVDLANSRHVLPLLDNLTRL
jgi:hypothetical protein